MRFRSRQHLSRQSDFAAIRKEGRRQFGAAFVFTFRERPGTTLEDLPRFAVVASRRVGPAATRNLLKRRLREIFRENQHLVPGNVDIIVTLRQRAVDFSFEDLRQHFLNAIRRSGISVPMSPKPADE
jgi:ribonuclease P protein component